VQSVSSALRLCRALLFCALLAGESSLAENREFLQTGNVIEILRLDGTTFLDAESSLAYDAHGRLLRNVSISDGVFGGVTISNQETTLYEYDRKGRLASSIAEMVDSRGVVLSRTITTRTNLNAHQIQETSLIDRGGDGTIDGISVVTSTYDNHKRLIRLETEIDYNADGATDIRWTESWDYDLENHRLIYLVQGDVDNDGIVNAAMKRIYTLDHRDNPVSFVAELHNFQSNIIAISIYARSGTLLYDKYGNVLETHADYFDWNGAEFGTGTARFFYERRSRVVHDSEEQAHSAAMSGAAMSQLHFGHLEDRSAISTPLPPVAAGAADTRGSSSPPSYDFAEPPSNSLFPGFILLPSPPSSPD